MFSKNTLAAMCLISGILSLSPLKSARADAEAIEAVKIQIEVTQVELQQITDAMAATREAVQKLAAEVASLESLYERTGKIEYKRLLDTAYASYQSAQAKLASEQVQYQTTKNKLFELTARLEELLRQKH